MSPNRHIASCKDVYRDMFGRDNVLKLSLVLLRWFSYSFGTLLAFHEKMSFFTAWKRLQSISVTQDNKIVVNKMDAIKKGQAKQSTQLSY